MFMIYFLKHFMKHENSENWFSEFSLSWKTLIWNSFPCLINSFVINDVYKSLKENVSITWKQAKWFSYFILQNLKDTEDRLEQFFSKLWMKTILTILMQLQDFKRIKHRGGIKNCFCFFPFLKNNWNLTEATGSCSVKKVFWGVFLPGNLRRSG